MEVTDYTVDVQINVDMERLKIPKNQAILYFKIPNKYHIESKQFVLIPREGIANDPVLWKEKFNCKLEGQEKNDTTTLYRLKLTAKDPKARMQQLFVWVDASNWTVSKVESIPYERRKLSAQFKQALYEGKYYLPSQIVLKFESEGQPPQQPQSGINLESDIAQYTPDMQRGMRSGTITISYFNYRINTGLDDSIFEKKSEEK